MYTMKALLLHLPCSMMLTMDVTFRYIAKSAPQRTECVPNDGASRVCRTVHLVKAAHLTTISPPGPLKLFTPAPLSPECIDRISEQMCAHAFTGHRTSLVRCMAILYSADRFFCIRKCSWTPSTVDRSSVMRAASLLFIWKNIMSSVHMIWVRQSPDVCVYSKLLHAEKKAPTTRLTRNFCLLIFAFSSILRICRSDIGTCLLVGGSFIL